MNIYEKLSKVQQELKVPKDLYNDFGKYKYRSAESILEALKPILGKHKLLLILEDKLENIGDRYYIRATAKLINLENKEAESIYTIAYAREEETKKGMDGSQITGASSSYARKYALNGLFAIDDTKDSDYTNKHEDKPKTSGKALSEGQVKRLYAIGYAAGLDNETINGQVKSKFNKQVKDLTKEEYDQVCNGYERLKKWED